MTVLSAKNTPRNSYTATGGQTAFTIGFEFFAIADVKVFKNATLMTYNADPTTTTTYKITGITNTSDEAYEFGNGGTVTFGSGLTAGDEVVIIRDIVVERTSDFNPAGAFDITTLNTQLDTIISMIADTQTQAERSVKLRDHDTVSANIELPVKNTRANKVLAFDSVGDVETTLSTTGLETIGTITSEIVTVADNTSNINTVAGISSNITTVAGISSNVTAVADNTTNINAVNSNSSNINTVASANSNISTVAGANSNITTLAGINSDITTVAGISSNVTTVAGISSAVSTVASANSNISTVASGISNINTVAGSISNVNTVAGSISNVNTVASNVSGVNSFAERYRVGSSDPSSSLDAGDLFFNTTSNTLKFYDSSSWNVIASTFTIDGASDTNLTSPADGALLLYDTGTSKFIDNVVSGDATLADTGVLTIADDAVTTAKIADNAVTTAKINADAVTGAEIADDAIDSEHYTDGSIDTAHIADNQITNAKMADDSVGSAELIDNSVGAAALNISGNGTSGQMIVSDADGSFSYADQPSAFNYASVSGATPSLDVGASNFFDQGTTTANTTLSFTNVPTQALWSYTARIGTSASTLNNCVAGSETQIQSGYSNIFGIALSSDGTKFYAFGYPGGVAANGIIRQYSLATAYDQTSTATFVREFVYGNSLSGIDLYKQNFTMDPTGTHFHMQGQSVIHHFVASTPYDISTLSKQSSTFNHSSQFTGDGGIAFNNDGTKMYLTKNTECFQYSLSSGYSLSSVTYDNKSLNYATVSSIDIGGCEGIVFNSDGSKLYMNNNSNNNDGLHAFPLSSAYDISTASYSSETKDFNTGSNNGHRGLAITDSFSRLYTSSTAMEVAQYNLNTPHTITLPASVKQEGITSFTKDRQIRYEFFTADGGTNVNLIHQEDKERL